ncbi:glycoside hydrolase family 13 protein [Jiulongibacter sediminis]|uniref:glycoside hydrolase family 13 protein n=1 Tax=Jiulongibacter sediminis TaxID=1605367 RepID=UPI0009E96346|nr:alpha-glucosidase [Jiulongibacter sediminis]TBX25203.1 oligo-1,6-glucosidase [Jiulongibacter sediminis]
MNKYLLSLLTGFLAFSCQPKAENESTTEKLDWWKELVIYQIYPRSFNDTNGDGIGDLNGIYEKLDYLKDLGIDAIWMCPFNSSPNADNGYDVSDYRNIQPEFGTMEDFDKLLKGMHDRGIKLVMDVVVNHSSNEHEWFKQSRSSRDNPYRDYYHWWPAEKGKPNYRYSLFDPKGDAWKYDSTTNAYYLHYFSEQQPDLNWENPKVRQEVYDIMKFWAEKGVDGFRLDAFQFAAKDTTFPKLPDGYEKNFFEYYAVQDGLHDYLKEMNEQVFSKYPVMSVAEGAGRNFQDAHDLVDASRNELNMAYAFDGVDVAQYGGYELSKMKQVFSKWDSAFADQGWLSVFLSNHDQARMVSRWGDDSPEFRAPSTKMLNTFILSMRGTPYCYYGDEIGMTNIDFQTIDQYQDIAAKNSYQKAMMEGEYMELFMRKLNFSSRDNGRTPMQWNTFQNAGFSTGKPWLPVNENYKTINVEASQNDPNSILNHFKKMVKLRKENLVLIHGTYELFAKEHPQIYAYTRTLGQEKMLILLNFSKQVTSLKLDENLALEEVLVNNYENVDLANGTVSLKPYQGMVFRLK